MPRPTRASAKNAHRSRHALPADPQLAAAFSSYPNPLRTRLLALRRLILDTAHATEGVGPLQETLKWGQVSYLTSESKSGSTIRIDRVRSTADQYALYFHCQTDLVETFRQLYPEMAYSGNRCILLDSGKEPPTDALRHCVALALTYHLSRRGKARRKD